MISVLFSTLFDRIIADGAPEMLSPAPAATPNDFFHTRSTDGLQTQAVRAPTIER
ncbi:hypothetical protein QFZ33_002099 [Arthrobacter globiformis]|nr:hypothetical protein [Arthrobacter globiformis]